MKKALFLFLCFCLLLIPSIVNAKEIESLNLKEALKSEGIEPLFDEYKETNDQAVIYFFRIKGDSKCVEFLNYLNSIYDEYGEFFKLVSYEIDNEENLELMNNVIDHMNASVTTAPFIIIGNIHFVTYEESLNENVIKAIITDFQNEEKIDNVEETLVKYYRNYDLIIGIVVLFVLVFVGLMIYASFKGNKNSD